MFSVKVEPLRFSRTKYGSVVGPIWVEMQSACFPGKSWSDFPVVILGWWFEAINGLCSGAPKRAECRFMEGPFAFEICAIEPDNWLLRFLRKDVLETRCLLESRQSPALMVREVQSSAKLVFRYCHERSWLSDDLIALETQCAKLDAQRRRGNF